ncbi:hypothetical protein MASR1M101_23380 [Gemmatimonas sp.]
MVPVHEQRERLGVTGQDLADEIGIGRVHGRVTRGADGTSQQGRSAERFALGLRKVLWVATEQRRALGYRITDRRSTVGWQPITHYP